MDLTKERQEIQTLIQEIKESLNLPLDPKEKADKPLSQEDLIAMQQRVEEIIGKLKERADHLVKESGLSKEELSNYVENPSNFTPEQWESVKAMKSDVDNFQQTLAATLQVQQEQTVAQDQKNISKLLTPNKSRRRRWIPS